jgi:hypothetical protein
MKRGKLIGLAILALAVGALPSAASAAFYGNFSAASLSGPYIINGTGSYIDALDDQGQITLNGVVAFSGTGGVTLATQGLSVAIAENGAEANGGIDEFSLNCTATLAASGSGYTVNSDGTGTLTLSLFNGSPDTCFNSTTPTVAVTLVFNMALSENFHGGTSNLSASAHSNLCMTGSTGPSSEADCATTGQDSIEGLTLNATLVHQ